MNGGREKGIVKGVLGGFETYMPLALYDKKLDKDEMQLKQYFRKPQELH